MQVPATIVVSRQKSLPCQTVNISTSGAKLDLPRDRMLPSEFEVVIPSASFAAAPSSSGAARIRSASSSSEAGRYARASGRDVSGAPGGNASSASSSAPRSNASTSPSMTCASSGVRPSSFSPP
ncbi:PilZ domain-containing protein [Micromonospora sp. STR1s_5]|nr:PilZ domain-containing protein [Micromonospora sp. STR1s_5]